MSPRDRDFGFSAWAACCGPGFRAFGRRGRRRQRMFDRGDVKFAILGLLEEKPMHGYEVMQRLEEQSGGYYSASPGSVYPVLQLLQDQDYVISEEVEGKRVYRITDKGRAFLEEHRERVDDVTDRVSDFGAWFGSRSMRDVTRSFVHLAQVSFDSATRASGNADALQAVKEILDRAAKDMEAGRWSRRTEST